MIKFLAIALFFLLLTIACGGDATPAPEPTPTTELLSTPEPTATPVPPTETPEPTSTPTPEPTSEPTATPRPEPSPTPKPTATHVPPPTQTQYESAMNDLFPDIQERMETVEPLWTVYFHSDDWQTPGINTTINGIFTLLKLENIVSHEGYQLVSPEMVVDREPDIIVADSMGSILENPDLSGLHMVQDPDHVPHHIFVLGDEYSFSPDSDHFKDAVRQFAAFVYPDVFGHYGKMDTDRGMGLEEGEEAGDDHDHDNGDGHSH